MSKLFKRLMKWIRNEEYYESMFDELRSDIENLKETIISLKSRDEEEGTLRLTKIKDVSDFVDKVNSRSNSHVHCGKYVRGSDEYALESIYREEIDWTAKELKGKSTEELKNNLASLEKEWSLELIPNTPIHDKDQIKIERFIIKKGYKKAIESLKEKAVGNE